MACQRTRAVASVAGRLTVGSGQDRAAWHRLPRLLPVMLRRIHPVPHAAGWGCQVPSNTCQQSHLPGEMQGYSTCMQFVLITFALEPPSGRDRGAYEPGFLT